MSNNEEFVKSHWTQTMVLGVVVVLAVSWQVVLEDTNLISHQTQGVVKGQATQNQENLMSLQKEEVLNYQNKLKNILGDYFEQRAEFDNPHQEWLFLINQTKYKIFFLSVPEEYTQLQVQIITTLDLERQAISGSSNIQIEQINQRWQNILGQYFWLNQ